nr:hypothetical protein Iba_chr14fCG7860 [Ipomoea batatas]
MVYLSTAARVNLLRSAGHKLRISVRSAIHRSKMEGYIYPPPQKPHQFGYYHPPPPPPPAYYQPHQYPSPAGYNPPPPAAVHHHPPPPYHPYPSPHAYYYPPAGGHQPQTSPNKASALGKIAGTIVGGLGLGIAANAISGAI